MFFFQQLAVSNYSPPSSPRPLHMTVRLVNKGVCGDHFRIFDLAQNMIMYINQFCYQSLTNHCLSAKIKKSSEKNPLK